MPDQRRVKTPGNFSRRPLPGHRILHRQIQGGRIDTLGINEKTAMVYIEANADMNKKLKGGSYE